MDEEGLGERQEQLGETILQLALKWMTLAHLWLLVAIVIQIERRSKCLNYVHG